eukprot:GILJ01003947.1.p1 GENE.GILJ01003947.1~~GILJ01003947.1.p1  ORF type:complete len:275 (+),score=27.87 GILJ01003947.1:43-867(+)
MGEAIRGLLDQLAAYRHKLLSRADIEAVKNSLPHLGLTDSSFPQMLSGAPFAVTSVDAFASWIGAKKKENVDAGSNSFRYYFDIDGTHLAAKVYPFDINNRNDPHCCVQIAIKKSYNMSNKKRRKESDSEDLHEEADIVESSSILPAASVSTMTTPSLVHYHSHSTDRELESGSDSDYCRMTQDHSSPYTVDSTSNESVYDPSPAPEPAPRCVLVDSAVLEQLMDTVTNHGNRLGYVEHNQVGMQQEINEITTRVQNLEMRMPIGSYGEWDTPF